MKSYFIVVGISLFACSSLLAAENITLFKCTSAKKFKDGQRHTVSFAISGFPGRNMELVEDSFKVSGQKKNQRSPMLTLEDNVGFDLKGGRLYMTGDGDGCELAKLVLLKDSGFRAGFFQSKDIGCGIDFYSTVSCSVRMPK